MTGVGVIGTGFMGVAHTEALRRLGLDVVGIVGSTPERARAKAATSPLPPVVDSVEELLADPAVAAVHVTSPNHCTPSTSGPSSPPASTSCARSRSASRPRRPSWSPMRRRRPASCTPSASTSATTPQNQNAAALVAAGAIGEPRFVTGRYHQDWLLLDTDWNWRLDAARQGGAAGRRRHRVALARPDPLRTGRQVVEVLADLHTFVTERNHPLGEVETFGAGGRRRRAGP